MARISIKEAVAIYPVSESTLRRDIKSGKVSSEKDDRGRRRIDTAELARVYGQLRQSTQSNEIQMTAVDTPDNAPDTVDTTHVDPKVVALLENQIVDLKAQLERAEVREDALIAERTKLLNIADRMLPTQKENEQRGWLQRVFGFGT